MPNGPPVSAQSVEDRRATCERPTTPCPTGLCLECEDIPEANKKPLSAVNRQLYLVSLQEAAALQKIAKLRMIAQRVPFRIGGQSNEMYIVDFKSTFQPFQR